jgi:ribosome-binding protein aMBF1 (putative translation factor)
MHVNVTPLKLGDDDYVVLPRTEYERIAALAEMAELPPLPEADDKGNYPAVEYLRASIARNIIKDRIKAGLSQKELAARAGIRVETLCRIETGKHTASVPTIEKIDRALKLPDRRKPARRRH